MSKGTKKKENIKKTVKAPAEAVTLKKTEVKITAAKGRPMLTWVGKRPLSRVTAFPAQHVESFSPAPLAGEGGDEGAIWKDWPSSYPKGGLLFHGDNKEILANLLANGFRGKVNLIYIDPPFDSGADYVRKVSLRGPKGTTKIEGETYALGEQIQYTDIWANDNYLQFMLERLMLLKELLSSNGVIALHCDFNKGHYLRCILDEVFGPENFVNDVVWFYENKPQFGFMQHLPRDHDYLLIYAKDFGQHKMFHQQVPVKKVQQQAVVAWDPIQKKRIAKRNEEGDIIYETREEKYMGSVWTIPLVHPIGHERTAYPTQKPEVVVENLIKAFSEDNALVMDSFIGSGTTAAVAQKLGRRWIGCDINKGAIQTASKRLQTIIKDQSEEHSNSTLSLGLTTEGGDKKAIKPAQTEFTIWRVNDYDLAIQHNEAVNLACEHIGVERTRTDAYFEGTLGKALVKIIPLGHPLTPLDLEELKRELEARPDEDRTITVVCLGMEIAAKAWIEDWHRLRKGKDAINKIEAIELRTDPKYGKFMKHEPAKAKVKISRKRDAISVEIEDFISPTIIERLAQQSGLLKPKIDDWRAMVDCVMIDIAYYGKVFNVILSDVPEKKTDLVQGSYELPAPSKETTVAVKIIDMLGEEVLVTKNV